MSAHTKRNSPPSVTRVSTLRPNFRKPAQAVVEGGASEQEPPHPSDAASERGPDYDLASIFPQDAVQITKETKELHRDHLQYRLLVVGVVALSLIVLLLTVPFSIAMALSFYKAPGAEQRELLREMMPFFTLVLGLGAGFVGARIGKK